ncbi:MAG TPA: MFS transporter [candidate division Zixibacteria bacterium]|nr:MFS transporter [candidate division Zixibacteria bacterium]
MESTRTVAQPAAIEDVVPPAATAGPWATAPKAAAADTAEGGRLAILQPLRVRDFRLVFTGESVSLIGSQFHFIALAWLALQLTGSGVVLGTVLMTAAIPRALFILLGGALSDRFSPRTLMLVSNAVRAFVVGIVAGLVLTDNAELWHLYVLAAIFGLVDAIFHPALNTIVPMLVSDRLLPAANGLVQVMVQLSGLIGPALAGLVVAAVQTGPAFAIDSGSFAVATLAILLVHGGRRAGGHADDEAQGLLASVGSGLTYTWRDPAVRSIIVLSAAFNFAFAGPVSVGLPYLADTRFSGPVDYGFMVSAFGAGALAGAVVAGSLKRVPRLGLVTLLIAGGLGIGIALVGLAPNVAVASALGMLIGVGIGFINVRTIAWLQARTLPAMRGRVMSLIMLGGVGMVPFSLAISGVIIDLGAVTFVFAMAGGIIVAAVMAGMLAGVPSRMTDAGAA